LQSSQLNDIDSEDLSDEDIEEEPDEKENDLIPSVNDPRLF
jgi:hypothetical protein